MHFQSAAEGKKKEAQKKRLNWYINISKIVPAGAGAGAAPSEQEEEDEEEEEEEEVEEEELPEG